MSTTINPITCADIQRILFSHYLRSDIVICPNTEAIGWEADLVVLQPTDYLAEIEIKVSRSDFKADFKKAAKHAGLAAGKKMHWRGQPNYFYFAMPAGMVKTEEVPAYCGLIYIHSTTEYGRKYERVEIVRMAPRLHTNKCSEKTLRRLARSLMYKVFNQGSHDLPEHAHLAFEEGATP